MSGVDTAETIVNAIVKFCVEIIHQIISFLPEFNIPDSRSRHTIVTYTQVVYSKPSDIANVSTITWFIVTECITNYHGYAPFVLITIQFFRHSWLVTGFVTREERQLPLVEQEMPTLDPWFSGILVALSLVFCVVFCTPLFVLLTFGFRFTASDYLCWDLHTVLTAMKKCMDMSKDQTVCQMFITSHFET